MIQDAVMDIAAEFSAVWRRYLCNYKVYDLDTTWPSFGTVDLILFPLRGKKGLSKQEKQILVGAAAYIGVTAYHSWVNFPGNFTIRLEVDANKQNEFILSAYEGDSLKQSIALISALKRALDTPPESYPVFGTLERKLQPTHNIVSLFATGVLTGLSPFGTGLWTDKKETLMARFITSTAKYISASSARFYKSLYPKDKIGGEIALYLHALSLPPAGFNEPFEFLRSATGLIEYLKNENATDEQIKLVAQRLLSFPDELISQTAFIVSAACGDCDKNVPLMGAAQSINCSKVPLRPATNLARMVMNRPADWLKLLEEGEFKLAKEIFEEDQTLGLLPLMKLGFDFYRQPEYRTLTTVLAWSDAGMAREAIDGLPKELASSPEAWFQAALIDFSLGDVKRTTFELAQLRQAIGKDKPTLLFDTLELEALCSFQAHDFTMAKESISQALSLNVPDRKRFLRISSTLASILFTEKRLEDSKNLLKVALPEALCPLSAILTAYRIERALGEDKKAKELLDRLVAMAPLDRRVFAIVAEHGMCS